MVGWTARHSEQSDWLTEPVEWCVTRLTFRSTFGSVWLARLAFLRINRKCTNPRDVDSISQHKATIVFFKSKNWQ